MPPARNGISEAYETTETNYFLKVLFLYFRSPNRRHRKYPTERKFLDRPSRYDRHRCYNNERFYLVLERRKRVKNLTGTLDHSSSSVGLFNATRRYTEYFGHFFVGTVLNEYR